MLFNSYAFIFLFLPLALVGFFQLARTSPAFAAGWLAAASLFFYGYWNPAYVGLLLGSITVNYAFGVWIAKAHAKQEFTRARQLLTLAVAANLLVLGYYKYANFFLASVNNAAGAHFSLMEIVLPLGISFFTFTQIAFLVDTYQGKVKEFNFIHYILFVSYFPHLIAGPVLHHKEIMPQFARASTYRFNYENVSAGLTLFVFGLFKKVFLADGLSPYVAPVFDAPAVGMHLTFLEAWGGVLCYALQLYFDFSGYSDMAIGLSRMFGVTLPFNFNSPYKAANIIGFWQRWHMTLSRFLRDYLYFPLGGNRRGKTRRYLNLLVTMLLGGLWHGAAWTFIIWGGLHGVYLVINHGWHAVRRKLGHDPDTPLSRPFHVLSIALTFLAVTVAWVFFRAHNLEHALAILQAMTGAGGFALPEAWLPQWEYLGRSLAQWGITFAPASGLVTGKQWLAILIGLVIVFFMPNTQEMMARHAFRGADNLTASRIQWHPTVLWAMVWAFLAYRSLWAMEVQVSDFLYFRF